MRPPSSKDLVGRVAYSRISRAITFFFGTMTIRGTVNHCNSSVLRSDISISFDSSHKCSITSIQGIENIISSPSLPPYYTPFFFTPYKVNTAATSPTTAATPPIATRPAPAVAIALVVAVAAEAPPVVVLVDSVTVPPTPATPALVALPAGYRGAGALVTTGETEVKELGALPAPVAAVCAALDETAEPAGPVVATTGKEVDEMTVLRAGQSVTEAAQEVMVMYSVE